MKAEIIKAEDYGLETATANELTVGLKVVKAERELLIKEFEDVSKLELTQENLPIFKILRLAIVKNRTQGIDKWHKTNKEFYLTGCKFIDAVKSKERAVNEQMEKKLMDAEKHFENLEKERFARIQIERVALLSDFVDEANEIDLSSMEDDLWEYYLAKKKQSYLDKAQAELDAEKERQAKIQAEKEEQERIRKENTKLKAEAEEFERLAKIEADKRAKTEKERQAKEDAERKLREEKERKKRAKYEAELKAEREEKNKIERKEKAKREKLEAELKAKVDEELKAKADEEQRCQDELNKGDEDKVKDLINDLEALKTKYVFKSVKSKKMYADIGLLIDKITNHIKK